MSNIKSKIYNISDDQFVSLVKQSITYTEILKYFNLRPVGGNIATVKRRMDKLNLNVLNFSSRRKEKSHNTYLTKDQVYSRLVSNSSYNKCYLKKCILKFDIIKYECSFCSNPGIWLNKKMVLQIDHINGVSDDNRVENLRFLCPNCHSQTNTFSGKNKIGSIQLKKISNNVCSICNTIYQGHNKKICQKCSKINTRKVKNRPTKDELEVLIKEMPFVKIANLYGISDTTIRKWAKEYSINYKSISPFAHSPR